MVGVVILEMSEAYKIRDQVGQHLWVGISPTRAASLYIL